MNRLNRRQALRVTAAGLAASAAPATSTAFPKGFLFGVATAAHQVEGNNTNSDSWVVEHIKPTIYADRSGDACDHYHRYADDIKLIASLGFNTYRFSVGWARIEPEPGLFSIAELDHYRRVLGTCHEHKLTPMVTLHHFTAPRWFAAQGGWENEDSTDLFVRYAERTTKHLGDMIGIATTFNEPHERHHMSIPPGSRIEPIPFNKDLTPNCPLVRDGTEAGSARRPRTSRCA